MWELPSSKANSYFLLRPTALIKDHDNKIVFLTFALAPNTKLIYHVDHISDVYCLCISTLVVLEIIVILPSKRNLGFAK